MEIKFRNHFSDIVWFSFYQLPRTRSTQIMLGILLLFVGYTFRDIVSQTSFSASGKVMVFIVLILGVILALYVVHFISLVLMQLVSSHSRLLVRNEKRVEISETGVISKTEMGRSEMKWSAIENIRQTKKYILIYISDRAAMLIPKRYFDNQAQAEEFYSYLNQRREKS